MAQVSAMGAALEQTEIPPELFVPFRGLRSTPLFFSDYCRKLTTHKGVTITRVIICTSEHLYLCHPNGDILRCFPYTAITRILHDEQRHQLGIVVPCEFDIAVETPLSFQLLHVIDVLRRMHGARSQLELIRVGPVPRPDGLLGFRPDGRAIWDETQKAARKRKRHSQTCTEKCMDYCGMEEAWIGVKDATYRYYRRAMRALDLGIEDDDEVLTTSTAAALNSASVSAPLPESMTGGGGAGSGGLDTMMLAAGKTSFALNRDAARQQMSSSTSNTSNGDQVEEDEEAKGDAAPGYRWYRPIKGNKTRAAQDAEAAALASDNEVLNLLLSPMLAQDEAWDGNGGSSSSAAAAADNGSKKSSRDEWWPGCQVGYPDGPYALSLAKPKGFKVALDQKNSEFAG